MRYPVDNGHYFISQGFSSAHTALDIAAAQSEPIHAPESGVIVGVNNNPGAYFGGNYVVLMGDSGYWHYLGHNSSNLVSINQRVNEGDHIANIGSTGQATGPHTHWEVSKNGVSVDPTPLVNNQSTEDKAVQDEIQKIWNVMNDFNKVRDQQIANLNGRVDSVDRDKAKLWESLDQTNKNADVLRGAINETAKHTGAAINLDDYEVQLVKKK